MVESLALRFGTRVLSLFAVGLALAAAVPGAVAEEVPNRNWTYWRGPEYNGISRETGLPDKFDPDGGEGSNVRWKREDLGMRSTPIVMNGRLYGNARHNPGTSKEQEKVFCLDAATGETIWEHAFNVYLSDVPDTRVGWGAVTGDPETGFVYCQGVCGHFVCLDGKTGELKWYVPLHERHGVLSTYGGRTNTPIIFEDLVISSAVVIGWGETAKPCHRYLALDKLTGEVVWQSGTRELPYDTTYSAPVLAVIAGEQQLIFGSGDGGVWAFQPRTGKPIWSYQFSKRGVNTSPVVVGNRVYIGHSEENVKGTFMGAVAAIDATGSGDVTESKRVWQLEQYMVGKSSPVFIDGKLFAIEDGAKLYILDGETGEKIYRKALGTVGRSSPLYADGKLYVTTANGRWYILRPEGDSVSILDKGRFDLGQECHGSPIAVNGRVYIPTVSCIYCLEDTSQEHGFSGIPELSQEAPVEDDPKPAHVQVVPADILMRPGESRDLAVRLFNANGQLLKTLPAGEVTFELEGPGEVSAGKFAAPSEARHAATSVTAKVGDLSGRARVRIVPDLPWSFDFEDAVIDEATGKGQPPITFLGVRYRHVVREVDGNKVMVKITTIPKGARSRGWMGHSDLSDYTIQADVMAEKKAEGEMPDIGLIAQRYVLDLQGTYQKLQIRSWAPQLRMAQTVDFPWKAGVWYTMKFKAALEGDKAVLRGKVWPKDEDEPADWTVVAEDAIPNTNGSPGLYGNARLAEIYLDNIRVQPNE